MKTTIRNLFILALLAAFHSPFSSVHAQGTAFTYQGRLNNSGAPANGSYDLAFTLYTTNTTGSIYAGPVTNLAVAVTNGLFITLVDFGNAYTGAGNWLQVAVSTNGANAFTTLAPRQQITPTPYALMANSASNLLGNLSTAQLSGSIAASSISGTLSSSQLGGVYTGAVALNNSGNSFSGNGGGLTNVSLSGIGPAGTFSLQPLYFPPSTTYSLPGGPTTELTADVNGDGKPDLIVGMNDIQGAPYNGAGVIIVFTNAGGGVFVAASTNLDTNGVTSLAVADFDGDGKPDMAVGDFVGYVIFKGNGDGTFTNVLDNSLGTVVFQPGRLLVAADINGDGYPDLIVGENGNPSDIKVLLNFAGGPGVFAFTQVQNIPLSFSAEVYALIAADVNNDGSPDFMLGGGSGIVTYTNHNGHFTAASTNSTLFTGGMVVGDVNGDGRPDLISWGDFGSSMEVLTNAGGGVFVSNNVFGGPITLSAAATTNAAGMITYVSSLNEQNSTVTVFANDGHGNFTQVGTANVGYVFEEEVGSFMAMADVLGNGNPDVLAANYEGNDVTELLGYPQTLSIQNQILLTNLQNSISGYFTGNGSALSNLNASQITSGTLSMAQLPTGIALLNSNQVFMGNNNFVGANNFFTGNTFAGAFFDGGHFSGNGGGLTNILHATTSTATSGTVTAATIYQSETTYLSNASTIPSLTIALPTSTVVGQTFLIHTKSAVTALTVTGGSFVDAAVTSLTAGQTVIYEAVTTTGMYIRLE
ncbi:MAG TPA: VCBS repeat-containing protein [Verrucomicrobiae bacterium]